MYLIVYAKEPDLAGANGQCADLFFKLQLIYLGLSVLLSVCLSHQKFSLALSKNKKKNQALLELISRFRDFVVVVG